MKEIAVTQNPSTDKMQLDKYRGYLGYEPLCMERIDEIRYLRFDEGLEDVDEEWWPLIYGEYQLERLPIVDRVAELGATTSVFMVIIDSNKFDVDHKPTSELLERQARHNNELGNLCAYLLADEDIAVDGVQITGPEGTEVSLDITHLGGVPEYRAEASGRGAYR